ncbi:hypothetical protein HPB50_008249 [Hyalomma asiaticum]|uniref:Uncharacterized protein n=1 Tax=Hyalomma asiaticum TaxID=266040 RepID=A0ACB7TB17_HYAAI|nr:hypothetical protein HPB50_008249 [Hyalomma asiaticum]
MDQAKAVPLAPILFIISLKPLLTSSVAGAAQIRGFPMTGVEDVKVVAYADDVSPFRKTPKKLV